MRKIFTHLKSVVAFAIVAAMTLSVSCSYDDTAIKKRVDKVEKSLAELTERVNQLEGQSVTLEDLLDGKAVVTKVEKNEAGDTTVTLSNGQSFVVLAEAETLQYRTVDGVLEISADGEEWVAVTVAPDCFVQSVVENEDGSVTFTLADGRVVTVDTAELIECAATRTQVYVIAGTTKAVPFTINDAVEDINIMNQPFGWSATVEEAVEVEDDDLGMGVLAVGGTNYVLNINGPSQALVNAGMAAKEGIVSVHFNTAAGACKVMNVSVNLAEITFAVDADGNITITNTMATEQENYWGEKFTDFADFWIGIMPKTLYDTYGKDALREDFGSWDFETAAATQRSTGLWNVADLQQYEEGVYEKETIEFTIDQLASAFYPQYQLEVGTEHVLFISLDEEMINYNVIPSLDNAIFANYKKVLVSAEFVEDSATWNDFTFKFNLAGYQYYVVGLLSDAEVEEYMADGQYASVEEFIAAYINGYGVMSSGAVFAGDCLDQEIKVSEFAQRSASGYGPSVAPATSYHFYVYPFNAASEMELYTHAVVAENLRYYGEFESTALVAGEFNPAAEYTVNEHVEDNISVEVELSGDVKSAYYTWFDDSMAYDPEAALDAVLNDVYGNFVQFDENTTSITAEKYEYYGLPNPIYLAIVAINADGQYVYVEKEFLYVEPDPIALVSWEYKGRNYDIDDNPETSGGDHVYVGKTAEGEEITIGLYYTYADENGVIVEGTYDYCANYFDAMYSYWNGFSIISDNRYPGSSLIVTADTVKIKIKGGNIYLYDKNAAPVEPDQPEEPEVFDPFAAAAVVTDTTFNGFNPYDVTFGFENGDQVVVRFNTDGAQYLHLGAWQADAWQNPHYISQVKYNGELAAITACNVAYENDAYTVTMTVYEYTNSTTLEYTYTGAIEGLNAPEACDCLTPQQPDQPEGGEGDVINVTILNQTVGYDQAGEKEVQFWYSATNAHVIDFKGMDNCTPGQPLKAGYYSSAEGTIDADYCIFDYGTTNGKMSSVECTVTDNGSGSLTYDAKFVYNGQNYAFVYTSPAQEEESGNTVELVSKSAGEQIGSYAYGCLLSDAEGNNQVKIAVDMYYSWDSATDFPKANDYATWQSSPSYIMQGSHFSFVNRSLKVNGVTYANDAISNAKLTVVEATSITVEFTVDGEDYKFVYNAF